MPRWRSCTWAWVHARVTARSKAVGSWCLSTRSSASSRDGATSVQNAIAHRGAGRQPNAAAKTEDRIEHGADACPRAAARRSPRSASGCSRPRPRKRARSVSNSTIADALAFHDGEVRRPDLAARPATACARRQQRADVGARTPSARRASRRPDAPRRPWQAPARARRRRSARSRACGFRGSRATRGGPRRRPRERRPPRASS